MRTAIKFEKARAKHLLTCGVVLLATTFVTGCVDGAEADPIERTWRLTALGGEPTLEGTLVDLTISDNTVSGTTGCNRYNGPATFDSDGSMALGPEFAVTFMACDQPIMDQEQQYLEMLTRVVSYRVVDDGLLLEDGDGVVIAEFD